MIQHMVCTYQMTAHALSLKFPEQRRWAESSSSFFFFLFGNCMSIWWLILWFKFTLFLSEYTYLMFFSFPFVSYNLVITESLLFHIALFLCMLTSWNKHWFIHAMLQYKLPSLVLFRSPHFRHFPSMWVYVGKNSQLIGVLILLQHTKYVILLVREFFFFRCSFISLALIDKEAH